MQGNDTPPATPGSPRRGHNAPAHPGGDALPPELSPDSAPTADSGDYTLPAALEAALQRAKASAQASAEKAAWDRGSKVHEVDDVGEGDIAALPEEGATAAAPANPSAARRRVAPRQMPARDTGFNVARVEAHREGAEAHWKGAAVTDASGNEGTRGVAFASAQTTGRLPKIDAAKVAGTTQPTREGSHHTPSAAGTTQATREGSHHTSSAAKRPGTPRPRHANSDPDTPTWGSRVLEWASVVAIALTISLLLRTFLFQAFWIPSSSMEETLQIGDNVAATPLVPMVGDIKRGDVVVFQDSLGWLPPPPERHGAGKYLNDTLVFLGLRPASGDQHLVKRVIGLPGDHVSVTPTDGRIHVNGVPVEEPYLAANANNSLVPFDITVPDGHLWVMGDNRNNSADSRLHPDTPFVPESAVVGKVVWVTWPVGHWGNPSDNDPFATVPDLTQK